MASGLLDKANIILTPTGYKAGTMYNVAPIEQPYEDFVFSRASVASRVNSSGLVEMVGRTLGNELIPNGTFESNVDGWSTNNANATFTWQSDETALFTSTSFAYVRLNPALSLSSGTYKVSFDVLSFEGTLSNVHIGLGASGNTVTTTGSYTYYTTASGTTEFQIRPNSGGTGSIKIDNISVKQIIDTNNIPRINYDSNGENGHWLLEPTSTNLLPYSEDFSEWTSKINIEVTLNNTTSPEGVVNAAFINEDNDNAQHFIGTSTSFTSGQDVTVSVFAKKNQRDVLQISPSGSYLNTSGYANYDLTNGLVTASGGGVTAEIEALSNGWYRCIAKFTATTTATGTLALFLQNSTTASRGGSYDGDGSSGLYLWGAQAEALSHSTSYIPTLTGSTVTRATETANGAGSADLINSTEGVLYAEIAALANDSQLEGLSLSDGTLNNRVVIFKWSASNRIQARVTSSGSNVFNNGYDVTDITDYNKIALKWKANDFALWINGVEVLTDNSGAAPIGLSSLQFDSATGTNTFYSKSKSVAVFNTALTDAELTELTS